MKYSRGSLKSPGTSKMATIALLHKNAVTLCNFSCKLSCTKHCTGVHTWERAGLIVKRSGNLLEIVAESRTVFYFQQWFLQLVSQRFRPLQGMSHCATYRVTCLAMALREQLHETLHSVPLTGAAFTSCLKYFLRTILQAKFPFDCCKYRTEKKEIPKTYFKP